MTDVYIAYAREDRERVRPLAESLQFEGWDVWWDPSEPSYDDSAAVDQKLGGAGAIVVVWSAYSRASEYVRSEAATGLYKNKLIQTRIDSASPPRPFDQLDVTDIGSWSGGRDDPNWRKTVSAIRLFAGPPGNTRSFSEQSPRKRKRPSYLEAARHIAVGPVLVAGLVIASVASFWFLDPMHLHTPAPAAPVETAAVVSNTASVPAGPALETADAAGFEDSPQAIADWSQVDRRSPVRLREFVAAWSRTSQAETARSMLRVLDAQAWVEAVTADNESAYNSYLKDFPAGGPAPGAMATAATDRLASLGVERNQAIEEIQRGLTALKLYDGAIDGKPGQGTTLAARNFAASKARSAPLLSSAAPRDLRNFSDAITKAVASAGGVLPAPTTLPSQPVIAVATTSAPSIKPAQPTPVAATNTASVKTAAEADRQRIAQAQAAVSAAAEKASAEKLTPADQQRLADANAWNEAQRLGTLSSYQTYLASYPTGAQVVAAKAAVTRLTRPAAYSVEQISPAMRSAVEAARRAQTTAVSRAASARQTAEAATSASGLRNITAADGDKYETQISSGAPNGLGSRTSGESRSVGDRYRGELRNGQSSGLGVYEYGDNVNNTIANALRYEGEYAADSTSGYGVTYWKNGDSFAGQQVGAPGSARGVLSFSNGQRYEGEMKNGVRNGLGVVWSTDGQVLMAGRWENGQLVEPTASTEAISLAPKSAN